MQIAAHSAMPHAMKHSLAAQISYYNEYIQRNPDWVFAGIYADEAYSGTKDDRPRFVQLIQDCKDGKIDRIITKSISRFARNTVTLLTTVRDLRRMGIGIYFEEQNIDTRMCWNTAIPFISVECMWSKNGLSQKKNYWRI